MFMILGDKSLENSMSLSGLGCDSSNWFTAKVVSQIGYHDCIFFVPINVLTPHGILEYDDYACISSAQLMTFWWDKVELAFLSYHIFVIFFTRAKFLENKIYTEKRQFFALNL